MTPSLIFPLYFQSSCRCDSNLNQYLNPMELSSFANVTFVTEYLCVLWSRFCKNKTIFAKSAVGSFSPPFSHLTDTTAFCAWSRSSWVTDVTERNSVIEALPFQLAENSHALIQELVDSSWLGCRSHLTRGNSCSGSFLLMHTAQRCSCHLLLQTHTWLSYWLINVCYPIFPKIKSSQNHPV